MRLNADEISAYAVTSLSMEHHVRPADVVHANGCGPRYRQLTKS